MTLKIVAIEKSYGSQKILNGISLDVEDGEIAVLLGPSGCGKTTLLRIISGLEEPDQGSIHWNDLNMVDVPVYQRGFGMVFQEYALFPHKSVGQNIEFGLRMKNWKESQINERVQQMLELVGLAGFEERPIYDLSGGEQQRVALARSLAPSPRLLLLDEPLGSLDRALRERLMVELRQILINAAEVTGRSAGIAAIYVTHDQEEAFALADRVAVMGSGIIEQVGNPQQLYRRPKNEYVARFLGMKNLVHAEVVDLSPPSVKTDFGEFEVNSLKDRQKGSTVLILIRPGSAKILTEGTSGENIVQGTLKGISFRGRHQLIDIWVPAGDKQRQLSFELPSEVTMTTETRDISVYLDPLGLMVLEQR